MPNVTFDFDPDQDVFVIINENESSASIKKASILETIVDSYVNEEDSVVTELSYLVKLTNEDTTMHISLDKVFGNKTDAFDYLETEIFT